MTTLHKKRTSIRNKKATDPIDQVIFEMGLRIRHLLLDRKLNLLILSNGAIIKSKISDFSKLNKASEMQLNNGSLISEGVGIDWPDLDEDLSLRGFIKSTFMDRTLRTLNRNQESIFV